MIGSVAFVSMEPVNWLRGGKIPWKSWTNVSGFLKGHEFLEPKSIFYSKAYRHTMPHTTLEPTRSKILSPPSVEAGFMKYILVYQNHSPVSNTTILQISLLWLINYGKSLKNYWFRKKLKSCFMTLANFIFFNPHRKSNRQHGEIFVVEIPKFRKL